MTDAGASATRADAPRPAPRAAVVVLNWNGWRDTVECLEAAQRSQGADFVIVVVDNGSRDDSLGRLRAWARGDLPVASPLVAYDAANKPLVAVEYGRDQAESGGLAASEARLAGEPAARRLVIVPLAANIGFAAANNVGIRYALARGFEFVLLLNNDAVVEPDTLRGLLATLVARKGWVGAAPKVVRRDRPDRLQYAGGTLRLWQARAVQVGRGRRDGLHWNGARRTGHVTACCALYRTSFLREAGLLDEDFFFGHEDAALSCTARRMSRALGVDLDHRVVHREGASLAEARAASVYYFNKYRLLLLAKHGSLADRLVAPFFLVATRAFKLPWLLLRGHGRLARAELAGYRDYLRGRLADHDRMGAGAAREE